MMISTAVNMRKYTSADEIRAALAELRDSAAVLQTRLAIENASITSLERRLATMIASRVACDDVDGGMQTRLEIENARITSSESRLGTMTDSPAACDDVDVDMVNCVVPFHGRSVHLCGSLSAAGSKVFVADYGVRPCISPETRLECSDVGYVHLKKKQKAGDVDRLMASAGCGCFRCVHELLCGGVNVNLTSGNGYTALDFAKWYGMEEMAQYLKARGGLPGANEAADWQRR
jgi:hypothetical protein